MQHTAHCNDGTLLGCGSLPADKHSACMQHIHQLIATKQEEKKKGQKGFQRTPAFVHSVVTEALQLFQVNGPASSCGSGLGGSGEMPRGGFTDVGLHTGGLPRDTCWPLVKETMQVCLNQPNTKSGPDASP